MGGDDSQKLLPWRGIYSSPGRKPPAQLPKSTISLKPAVGISRGAPWPLGLWPQLRPAWVIFGKHRWVNSDARRRIRDALNRAASEEGQWTEKRKVSGEAGIREIGRRLNAGEGLADGREFGNCTKMLMV